MRCGTYRARTLLVKYGGDVTPLPPRKTGGDSRTLFIEIAASRDKLASHYSRLDFDRRVAFIRILFPRFIIRSSSTRAPPTPRFGPTFQPFRSLRRNRNYVHDHDTTSIFLFRSEPSPIFEHGPPPLPPPPLPNRR